MSILVKLRSTLGCQLGFEEGDDNFALLAALSGGDPANTVTNPDGSITETYSSGLVVVTTFPTPTTMLRTFSGLITGTIHTTFNSDGSITEV